MFQQILFTQFKWTRTLLLSMAVFTFAVPMLAWNIGGDNTSLAPLAVINGFSMVGPLLVIAAWTLGFLLAALPWGADSQSRHVYALSLPIPWERYVGLRFSAGALTLLIPTISLLLGSLLVLAMIDLPGSLRAYPITLALRFFLGTLLAYSASFLLQYVAGRRAPMVLLVMLIVGLGSFVAVAVFNRSDIVERVVDLLVQWPGPLSIFASEWKLVDV
jgi:hypothetical protein